MERCQQRSRNCQYPAYRYGCHAMIKTFRPFKVPILIALGVGFIFVLYLPVLRKIRTDEPFARATIDSAGGATNVLANCRNMMRSRTTAENLSEPEVLLND